LAFPGLNRFKAELREGARANYFDMTIAIPGALGLDGSRAMQFLCNAANLPGFKTNKITIKYFGREVFYSGDRTYGDLKVTIINDENFRVRRALESWMSLMQSAQSNLSSRRFLTGVNGYSSTAIVRQHGRDGNVKRQYRFIDVWPMDLADINLSWEGRGEGFETFTADFAYSYWEPIMGAGAVDPVVAI
jgi:hypothetical protein